MEINIYWNNQKEASCFKFTLKCVVFIFSKTRVNIFCPFFLYSPLILIQG